LTAAGQFTVIIKTANVVPVGVTARIRFAPGRFAKFHCKTSPRVKKDLRRKSHFQRGCSLRAAELN
jgi:hypothetical protein